MLNYPDINPVALQLGPIKIYWYGLMYFVGFLSAWGLAVYRTTKYQSPLKKNQVPDLILYLALGAVIGGRIGFMLLYNFGYLSENPSSIFKVWEGGMSFHGGLVGVLISALLFSIKVKKSFFEITDFVAPLVPIGLAAGRIGNFINGELYGRVTDVPWAMVFPTGGNLPRHPSQLYEFFLEGVLLFIILWVYSAKPRPTMAVSGLFLVGYSIARIFVEFFRAPDIDFVAFNWLTMGQFLSLPMVIIGALLLTYAYHKKGKTTS